MPHAEYGYFEQDDSADQEQWCRHMPGKACSDTRAGDRTNRRAGCDKSEQALALFRIEGVDNERPEHRHDKQIENRDPDKECTTNQDCLRGVGKMQRDREQKDVGREKEVGKGYETRARQRLYEKSVGNIECQ